MAIPTATTFETIIVVQRRNNPSTADYFSYSSFGGYARKSHRLDWVAYDEHHRYWTGRNGGNDPTSTYRRFVKDGLIDSVNSRIDRLRDCDTEFGDTAL